MQHARSLALVLVCCAGATLAAPKAAAHEAGDWILRVGFHHVDPKSDNGDVVEVEPDTMATFDVTYMITRHWAVELLAALPFEHDIELIDGPTVASTKHLPPTLSGIYYFIPNGRVQPYVGAGINVTLFFDEQTSGALEGTNLSLDTSVGAAAVAGVDVAVTDRWFVNADVRYFDIDTDARLDGTDLETVEVDPWAIGFNIGYRF